MLPWDAMLRAALTAGIAPEAFWRLSLREWRWLAGKGEGMDGARLAALMGAYPDCPPGAHFGGSRGQEPQAPNMPPSAPAFAGVSGEKEN